ncbi:MULTISPECIES: 2-hydroxychromene-2-carboxylate isomerase [Ramlibacter]|uniref:2-hydroxychromene-2-carboxylate isomerase n=1 Tax=Ramlibacter pinisoli TaxID=2682844 RepID=A0A6N8IS20_9BURK|nr:MULTISPECIES: 2-hydroxychromene-2-carboxylate isomerase [Ramlibacter]MBA2964744.1 2-hydroxychromene-2-carboxylate isomerase [Ramlibacter sp. CGMCC 1.13660]MVQ29709.1 2-hydroxychromene-2-carboxylate isomerase [Ramlibacter pinisoli]
MAKDLEFYFDVGSPAAYLAWTQIPRLSAATGAQVHYRPFLLGGVFQATGNRSPMEVPAKSRFMQDDLARYAVRYGVPYRHNPHFPINTLMLMRGATGLQMRQPDRLLPYGDAVYRAIWVDGRNMNDPAEVGAVLQQAGFEPQVLLALTQDPEVKERLKTVTQEAVARGVFGAPSFFVGDTLYWGQDRLDFVQQALA